MLAESTITLSTPALATGAMQPEAVAPRLVAGANRRGRGQSEVPPGRLELGDQAREITGGHRPYARRCGHRRGAGQGPLRIAKIKGDV